MMGYYGMMGGGGIFGILILGLVVFLAIRLYNNSNGFSTRNNSYTRKNDPLETLKEKYAEGEISEEEYERKRKILKD